MTKENLLKATSLNNQIRSRESDLKDIKYYEDKYSDYPVLLRLKRTNNDLYSEICIYNEALKKEILNLVKIHFISNIQECEKELEQL